MRKLIYWAFAFSLCVLMGCKDDGVRVEVVRYAINEPVFMSISEFRNSVKVTDEVVPITKRGKICFYKDYLYISSPDKGIHIVDNRNPASPRIVGFVELIGNEDLSIKDDKLYADSYVDLVWFDISDPERPELEGRVENAFRYALPTIENGYGFDYNMCYSEEARAAAIERLAGEESEDTLDYIISVDIFSEGVDVPEINQVIMLRPTESPIVFIQQLGRGLRKAENKEYVVVLDFIGNYRNNFMIPIALSGDRSYNKDNIRRYVTEGGRVIPGASTIHFDEISRKRIFQAIDNANFSDIKLIRENYTNLKNKLGHIPALADFDKYGEMDVLRIFDNNSLGSYYKFLVKYEKEYTIRLSEDEEKAIEFISKKLASGKRIHELELLKRTLQYHHGIIGRLQEHLSEKYHCEMDEYCTENVINMMTNEFPTSAAKKTYAQCVFLKKEQDDYGISDVYGKMLQNPEFCAILEELVDFGISRYKVNYSYHYQDTNLVLYQKYTYEDACRLLNWERNEVPLNIGGYKYDKKTKTFPIFINYDKQDNISDTTKYEDHFVAENRLIAISKCGRSMDSEDVQNFLNATERGIDVQLFVRKNKAD